jgi:glutathione S-transferase
LHESGDLLADGWAFLRNRQWRNAFQSAQEETSIYRGWDPKDRRFRLHIGILRKTYGDALDGALSEGERIVAHALRRLFEESLYWVALHTRWIEESIYLETRKQFFADVPPVMRELIAARVRKQIRRDLVGQGMGRHSRDEIYLIGKADLNAVSVWLGDKPFMMGATPTSLDTIAYAFLANILVPPLESPLKDHGLSLPNLPAYCERMNTRYYKSEKSP